MGYDGIYLSRVMKPQLVTWQQNTRMLGRMAADKLVQMIEHPRVTLAEQIPVTGLPGGRLGAQHRINALDLVPGESEP